MPQRKMSNSPAGKGDRDRSNPQKYNEGLSGISGFSWSNNWAKGAKLNKEAIEDLLAPRKDPEEYDADLPFGIEFRKDCDKAVKDHNKRIDVIIRDALIGNG